MKPRLILMTLAMVCSLPAYAEYSYQLLLPPDAENARLTGITKDGTVVGWVGGEFGFEYSCDYDLKKGFYTAISLLSIRRHGTKRSFATQEE